MIKVFRVDPRFIRLSGWVSLCWAAALSPEAQTVVGVYSNAAPIAIPSQGSGLPYPSGVTVAGITDAVAAVTVQINGLGHTWPADVNLLLAGPTGARVLLMSAAGGGNRITNVNLTFSDQATAFLPRNATVQSGSYRPTAYHANPAFPAPAPTGPYGTNLSAFAGLSPNGTWQLYILDDAAQDQGTIAGGWTLTLSAWVSTPPTSIPVVWWTNQADDNHNGCYESATLNWLPAGSLSGIYLVYEIASFRTNLTSWIPFYTNSPHAISGTNGSNAQSVDIPVDPAKGNCTAYDYKVEIYQAGLTLPDAVHSGDYDPLLKAHPEEGVPDVIVWTPVISPYFTTTYFPPDDCAIQHGCTLQGTRRLLRFTTQARNIGKTDLYLGGPSNNRLFVWDPCHGHWHYNNYASYRLLSDNATVAAGNKLGFCVEDIGRWDSQSPPTSRYNCANQGIQAGWYDVYTGDITCQWIDVTGIPPGNYTLEIHLNPYGYIKEANTNNNVGTVPVTIVNLAPTLSALPNQVTPWNTPTTPLAFDVWDAETAWDSLIITGSSSNPGLVPNASILFGGAGTNRTVTVVPAPNQTGSATITVQVNDGNGGLTSRAFNIEVVPASLLSIDVTPSIRAVSIGESVQFTATGTMSDGTKPDLTTSVVWSSGTPPVATISALGKATVVGVGTTQIKATQATVSGTAALTGLAGVGATTFFGGGTITISPIGVASPYPSVIPVFGLTGAVSKVSATLYQFRHTWPHDVGVMLVSPGGVSTLLMADVGGSTSVSNVTLTFDDDAAGSIPNGALTSGTYKPTSLNAADPFQPPAPTGPYSASLSVFTNLPPNGNWSLYVIDDEVGDSGSIAGGWSLSLSTIPATPPTVSTIANQATAMNSPTPPIPFVVADALTPPAQLRVGGTSSNPTLLPSSNLFFGGTGSNRTVSLLPATGQIGTTTITVTVTNMTQLSTATSFTLMVTNSPFSSTFANPSTVTIPSLGPATPYPSTISVSGMGYPTKVTATLYNLNHTWPNDVGVLLVSPVGQKTLLLADRGGGNRVLNATLTFDDAATASLGPGPIVSGTYKPSSGNPNDPFPPGAPPGPYTASLAVFNALDPNGVWSLYVMDDAASDAGAILNGWGLTIYAGSIGVIPPAALASSRAPHTDGSGLFSADNPVPVSAGAAVIEAINPMPDGQILLVARGIPGQRYVLQATTNYTVWSNLFTNAPGSDRFEYLDRTTPPSTRRYYRVRTLE